VGSMLEVRSMPSAMGILGEAAKKGSDSCTDEEHLIVYWISYVVFWGPPACAYILSAGDLNKELGRRSSTCSHGFEGIYGTLVFSINYILSFLTRTSKSSVKTCDLSFSDFIYNLQFSERI